MAQTRGRFDDREVLQRITDTQFQAMVRRGLTREEFTNTITRDVKNMACRAERDYLRMPEHLDDWYDGLIRMLRSIDIQFSSVRAEHREQQRQLQREPAEWQRYLEKMDRWRVSIRTLRGYIEDRIAEVRRLRRHFAPGRGQVVIASETLEAVLESIQRHRDTNDDGLEDEDERLWSVLDREDIKTLWQLLHQDDGAMAERHTRSA